MQPIQRCLNSKLTELCKKSIQIEALNEKIRDYLPEAMHAHCHVASFTQGCLNIMVNHASWASTLRFMLPELRDQLRGKAGMFQLTSIKITLNTEDTVRRETPPASQTTLSPKARALILQSTEQCTYEPLKKALQALTLPK